MKNMDRHGDHNSPKWARIGSIRIVFGTGHLLFAVLFGETCKDCLMFMYVLHRL